MNENQFERVTGYEDADLPVRKTEYAAGYDIKPYENGVVLPHQTKLIPTGIKCRLNYDEHIQLHLRSSVGINNDVMLANGTGIIDADYYNNDDNEGHIMIALLNFGKEQVTLEKGERVAQGIFSKYLITNDDDATGVRTGGIGSTGTM